MRLVDVDVALVKNTDGSKWHRAGVTHADGTSASVRIFVPHDLDHFVIESSLGITHGFWGIFAAGGWRRQSNSHRQGTRAGRRPPQEDWMTPWCASTLPT